MSQRMKTFECLAILDDGKNAEITYLSKYIHAGKFINEIVECIIHGATQRETITQRDYDWPEGILSAVENNSRYQWSQRRNICPELNN